MLTFIRIHVIVRVGNHSHTYRKGDFMKRERFETTLKPELKEKLKVVAIKKKKNINEMIEEWIAILKVNEVTDDNK